MQAILWTITGCLILLGLSALTLSRRVKQAADLQQTEEELIEADIRAAAEHSKPDAAWADFKRRYPDLFEEEQ